MAQTNGIGAVGNLAASLNVNQVQKDQTVKPAAVSDVSSGAALDKASFSLAGGFAAQASSDGDVRTEKVAALQQAIASGSYNVSSSDVAGKMIDSLLE